MSTQTIFQAGNSRVVAIPKDIADELGFKPGHKVVVEKADDDTITIKKPQQKLAKATKSDKEFNEWLEPFLAENGEILDELATR